MFLITNILFIFIIFLLFVFQNSKNYFWASDRSSILSEFGTLHMEFVYLSDITGNDIYKQKVFHIRQFVRNLDRPNGLYPNFLNPITGKWGQRNYFLLLF